jgi:hypothetical protein
MLRPLSRICCWVTNCHTEALEHVRTSLLRDIMHKTYRPEDCDRLLLEVIFAKIVLGVVNSDSTCSASCESCVVDYRHAVV